ncbi:reverse transcriptase [Phytophthora cinnamomi]|uniref:reverse transcriptase n=1 Tax=Phytophthora cinnamomi TaxID=4785 RepID=UPI00355940F8|nr:reverse transcriptase [Phytophthora cinnamomi]
MSRLDFEEVDTPRSLLRYDWQQVPSKTEKRVVNVRFSYKQRVFVEHFIVLDLDDKFDVVMGMPWLARHDPVIDWKKRTLVRFGRDSGTESDGPVTQRAPAGARGSPVETALYAAVPECSGSARGRAQETHVGNAADVGPGCTTKRHAIKPGLISRARRQGLPAKDITVQPGCTKENAVKPGLISRARGQGPPANDCPRPGLDKKTTVRSRAPHNKKTAQAENVAQVSVRDRDVTRAVCWQTAAVTPNVKTLSVLTRTDTGFQYRDMELASPPTTASELTSLPAMSWKLRATCTMDASNKSAFFGQRKNGDESEELRQLFMEVPLRVKTLSAKTKRERFEE